MIRIVGSSTLDLRNPDFGDVFRRNTNSIIRHTRAGELKYARPSTWFTYDSLAFTITRLSQQEMQDFRDLMVLDAGLTFTISRREAGPTIVWSYTGVITTPIFDIIRLRPPCSYDITFEFQAAKL
jgi:hypothetical protein